MLLWRFAAALDMVLAGARRRASAQSYPDKTVRVVVAFGAGGTLDTLARIVSVKLSDCGSQQVGGGEPPRRRRQHRRGAGPAQAPPDGYTLHFGAQTLAVNVTIQPLKGFDPVRDLEPVVFVGTAQDVLMVPPDFPAKTVQELIDIARSDRASSTMPPPAPAPPAISPPCCSASSPG